MVLFNVINPTICLKKSFNDEFLLLCRRISNGIITLELTWLVIKRKDMHMSVEYEYYLGVRNLETKMISLIGPYDKDGEALPLMVRGSRSSLCKKMYIVKEEHLDDEAKKEFKTEDWFGKKVLMEVRWKEFSFDVRTPLISRYVYKDCFIHEREVDREYYQSDGMEDFTMSEAAYAGFCNAYFQNNKTRHEILPSWNDVIIKTKPSDYLLYRWIDYESSEFEEWLFCETAESMGLAFHCGENEQTIILEVHGF